MAAMYSARVLVAGSDIQGLLGRCTGWMVENYFDIQIFDLSRILAKK
jgi:hypothetical protein